MSWSFPLLALFGPRAMSASVPLLGVKRTSPIEVKNREHAAYGRG